MFIIDFLLTKKVKLEKSIANILESDVDEKYYLSDEQIKSFKNSTYNTTRNRLQKKQYCRTLCARDYKDVPVVEVVGKIDGSFEISRRVYGDNGISPTLATAQGGGQIPKILQRGRGFNKGGIKGENGVSPTLTSCSWENNNHLIIKNRIRKFTPLEFWRLQDFY